MMGSVGGFCSGYGTVILFENCLASTFGFSSELSARVPSFVIKGGLVSSFVLSCFSLTIFHHNGYFSPKAEWTISEYIPFVV